MLTRKSKIDGVILIQIRVSVPNSSRKAVASKEGYQCVELGNIPPHAARQ